MAVRAETMAIAHELVEPVIVPKEVAARETAKIAGGDYDLPTSRVEISKHSQDVSPQTLSNKDIRCVLHVADSGEGLVQVIFPKKDKVKDHDIFIPRNTLAGIQDDMPVEFGDEDQEYVKIYSVIDIVK